MGGNTSEALYELTGCPVEDHNLSKIGREEAWELLRSACCDGRLVSVGHIGTSVLGQEGVDGALLGPLGIRKNHAYAIIEATLEHIKVYNPGEEPRGWEIGRPGAPIGSLVQAAIGRTLRWDPRRGPGDAVRAETGSSMSSGQLMIRRESHQSDLLVAAAAGSNDAFEGETNGKGTHIVPRKEFLRRWKQQPSGVFNRAQVCRLTGGRAFYRVFGGQRWDASQGEPHAARLLQTMMCMAPLLCFSHPSGCRCGPLAQTPPPPPPSFPTLCFPSPPFASRDSRREHQLSCDVSHKSCTVLGFSKPVSRATACMFEAMICISYLLPVEHWKHCSDRVSWHPLTTPGALLCSITASSCTVDIVVGQPDQRSASKGAGIVDGASSEGNKLDYPQIGLTVLRLKDGASLPMLTPDRSSPSLTCCAPLRCAL